jgi:hypothetical protein
MNENCTSALVIAMAMVGFMAGVIAGEMRERHEIADAICNGDRYTYEVDRQRGNRPVCLVPR